MTKEYKDQFQKFIDFGLTERESKVYMTLLTKKGFTTSELQDTVDITRTKIYEILHKMLVRGICTERIIGNVKYYEAVEPKIAFQRVFDKYKEECEGEFDKRKKLKDELIKVLNPVFDKNKDEESPLDFIEILKDKDQIQKRYITALREAKDDFLTFNKGPYVCDTSGRLNKQINEEAKLLKRKVLCRNIYEFGELKGTDWLVKYLKNQAKLGQQARVTKSLPIKMVVSDEKKVILPLQQKAGDKNGFTLLYIEHCGLALACKSLFNSLWEKSEQFDF